jgi:peptide/nickel transport system substrate-binding protein
VRRAVNKALDRHEYVAKTLGAAYISTCQVLPPDSAGYRRTCPWGAGGARAIGPAKRLVRSAGQAGQPVTVWVPKTRATQGRFMVSLLNSIGLKAHLKVLSDLGTYFSAVIDPRTKAQIGFYGWGTDFPSPGGFLQPLFSCGSEPNVSGFCDPAVDHLFAAAQAAQARDPATAPLLWQKAERAILAKAPVVPAANSENIAFVAKGVGNFQYHPQLGVLLDQLWLK